jgi:hypothetical protein
VGFIKAGFLNKRWHHFLDGICVIFLFMAGRGIGMGMGRPGPGLGPGPAASRPI